MYTIRASEDCQLRVLEKLTEAEVHISVIGESMFVCLFVCLFVR
jgi:hypothetical protein